jgi:YVTN family beta-propeller protein
VRRTAKLPAPTAAAPNLLVRLAQWLVPTAEAKRILVGGATLSPDGRTLFVLDDKGYLAINTNDLSLRGRYLKDWMLDSLAVSPNGARLYAVNAERSKVLQLDPATGAVVAQIAVSGGPWGVLRVEAKR